MVIQQSATGTICLYTYSYTKQQSHSALASGTPTRNALHTQFIVGMRDWFESINSLWLSTNCEDCYEEGNKNKIVHTVNHDIAFQLNIIPALWRTARLLYTCQNRDARNYAESLEKPCIYNQKLTPYPWWPRIVATACDRIWRVIIVATKRASMNPCNVKTS